MKLERQRCSARSKQTGEPCKLNAIPGGTVCRFHGGAAPAVRAAASRRVERARILGDIGQVLDELELAHADADPLDALVDAVIRARAMATVLGSMLDASKPGFGAQLELYERWVALQARTAKLALEAGVDERRVRIAEDQAEQLAQVLQFYAVAWLDLVSDRIPGAGALRSELEALLPGLMVDAIGRVHPTVAGAAVDVEGRVKEV